MIDKEFQLRRELEEAQRAKEVHEKVRPALNHIRNTLHEKWENSNAEDTDGRERTWMMLKALKELDRYYLKRINTGKLAEEQLKKVKNG